MLKTISNLKGVQTLNKEELKSINGSRMKMPEYDCYSQYDVCNDIWPNHHDNFVKCMKGC